MWGPLRQAQGKTLENLGLNLREAQERVSYKTSSRSPLNVIALPSQTIIPHPSITVIPHLMRDLSFMNVVTEMPSMLFLNEKGFVKLRSHDGRSRIGVRDDEQERTFPQQEITDDDCRYSKPASPFGSLRDRAG